MIPAHQRLEQEFARFIEQEPTHVVACSSGTAALHLALEALNLPPGSYVAVPDFTMVACARAVTLAGLVPLFVDCNASNLVMDPNELEVILQESRIEGKHVSAIMAVHIYGRSCDMEAISKLALQYSAVVIEDMAEAHCQSQHPMSVAACWSFYKNKVIAGEEGGAILFKRINCADKAKKLRSLGFTEAHDYWHIPRGCNYRLADCLAEKVLTSIEQYPQNIDLRRRNEGLWNIYIPGRWKMFERITPWVYDFRIPGLDYETQYRIVKGLQRMGIQARCGFKPCHAQMEYNLKSDGRYSNSIKASREIIYLPLNEEFPWQLIKQAVQYVILT